MEKKPHERDPEAPNRARPDDDSGDDSATPVDGPGGEEDGSGATSQDEPG